MTLHLLLHLADRKDPVTSEALAGAMATNSVVIRRTIGGLRDLGLVQARKGHNGGWVLARDLSEISLRDVYDALGSPTLLALSHRTESPDCLVEQAVNSALGEAFEAAEAGLLARFGEVTLAALQADVHKSIKEIPDLCANGRVA